MQAKNIKMVFLRVPSSMKKTPSHTVPCVSLHICVFFEEITTQHTNWLGKKIKQTGGERSAGYGLTERS